MRNDFLKEYEVTLTTKGPVHIGSGELAGAATIRIVAWGVGAKPPY